ncbi:AraC family transcriptional regulator [Maricurvus nonylphenolicus]
MLGIDMRNGAEDEALFTDSDILLGSWEAAEELGIDLSDSLAVSGISKQQLLSPKTFLGYHQVVTFLDDVAARNRCPHFGFYVAKHQQPFRFGALAQVSKLCSTVGESLAKSFKYTQLYNQASLWQVCEEGDYIVMKRQQRVAYTGSMVQLHLLAVTLMVKAARDLIKGNYPVTSVSFSHARPENSEIYSRYFQAPVNFDQDYDGYVFPKSYLSIPIATADPELLAIVEEHLSGLLSEKTDQDVIENVRTLIRANLGTNLCNLDGISQLMGKHPRALQRELKEFDVGFRDLLIEIRQEVAEHYLQSSNISLVDLADMLGYNNVSAFSRAFKVASGQSPQEWRQLYA